LHALFANPSMDEALARPELRRRFNPASVNCRTDMPPPFTDKQRAGIPRVVRMSP
jgi:hypothetical protein